MVACVWLLLTDTADLKRTHAWTRASVRIHCHINNEKPWFFFINKDIVKFLKVTFFAHKQTYLPIYTVIHKINLATSVAFFFHPETFLKVTCNKCVTNTREQAGGFLVCLLFFDPVPTQPTETEKLSHSLAQCKKLTLGNTHGCELWTTHNSGTSHALNILRGVSVCLFV